MKSILFLILAFQLTGCSFGTFTLPDHESDIPENKVEAFSESTSTIVEEKMSFAPIVWFQVDNVRKADNQFESENFTMGPLYLYIGADNATYDEDGKLIYHSTWGSYLWDILGSYYKRRFIQDDQWVEETHKMFLLGLFGYSDTREGKCCSFLFIPIPVGD